jgi:hypothetical protein
MSKVAIRLDPRQLDNPDADIRYLLPDLLVERSAGVLSDDGYDYVGLEPYLILFFKASELEPALACAIEVIENVRVLNNDLRHATVVAIERDGRHEIVYPSNFAGPFLPDQA